MEYEDTISDTNHSEDELELIALLKTIWKGRKMVIWCVLAFGAIGLFKALTNPIVYTASTIMVSQGASRSGGYGGLGGLAAIAGINLNDMGSGSQDLPTSLYPEIVKSYPFQKEIIHVPLKWNSSDKPMSLFEYSKKNSKPDIANVIKKYTLGLPGVVMSIFKKGKDYNKEMVYNESDSLFPITIAERSLCDGLSGNLFLKVDNKNGYLSLIGMGPEPLMTAQLVDKAQKLLQARIASYRTQKAEQNLAFILDRYTESKNEFERVQDRLARFRDRNLNMASNLAKTEEERLQSEYQLAFSVHSELAKQLESSKIKIKEDTPVFSIIQPVSIPLNKTEPKKVKILIVYLFVGGIIGLGLVLVKNNWGPIKRKWKYS